jgi:hypothetical protein
MSHLLHLVVFASLIALFFAHLLGDQKPRWRTGLWLWISVVGGGFLLAHLMFPFSG